MIERAVRCLETGGRVVLRGSKKQLRTRRHLHSGFWSHGAGSIDLPAWWIFFLQTPPSGHGLFSTRKREEAYETVSAGLQDIFLDFLYPVQTLALIRRIRRSTNAHCHAAQNVKQYSRSYTSLARYFLTATKATQAREAPYSTLPGSNQAGDAIRKGINELLDSKDTTGLQDELWQSYQDLLDMSQSLSPHELIKMLRSLVMSQRTVDMERAVALFERIPVGQRRAIHYSYAVFAALNLKDLDTAVSIHREASSRINGSIGTAAILRYTIEQETWTVAIDIWRNLWENKLSYYASPEIWTAVDALPLAELMAKADSAAGFAVSVSESAGNNAAAARDFALELIRRAFRTRGVTFSVNQQWDLTKKVRTLDESDKSTLEEALNQLLSIDQREHGHRALMLYRDLRKDPTFAPSRGLLKIITRKSLENKRPLGILTTLDDWRTYFTAVPIAVALDAARIFAQTGQLEAMQKLFQDFVSEHGNPRIHRLYHSLLLVFNRRADTRGITDCLHELQEKYDFVPDAKAYNFIISTFARVGDIDGALNYFKQLRDAGLRPDSTTYSHLMSMYGKRGDRDAVDDLYEQSKVEGIPTTNNMIEALVLANVKDGHLKEAESLISKALPKEGHESRVFMWNVLLNAYALREEVDKVSQLHKKMLEQGVSSDKMTYAALMTSLAIVKFPDGAKKIMNTVMPRNKIKPIALHYAIVMNGYLATREYGKIFQLYKAMLQQGLSPNMSTQNVLLRAAASVDQTSPSTTNDAVEHTDFVRAQQIFEQTLATLDPMELAASEPRLFGGPNPLNEAFSSTHFDYLMFLYGKEGAFAKVSELYDRWITTPLPLRGSDQDIETSLPMRLLSALMVANIRAENHEDVDRCWNLALEKSEQLACKSKADVFRPGWVLPSRRFIINLPLHQYIASLTAQSRTADLINTIDDLLRAGYVLNSSNWNTYIQALARSGNHSDHALAFELCERELIPRWMGWAALGDPIYFKPKLRAAQRHMLLRQDQKLPAYLTLVWLARAYLEAKSRGKSGTMRRLEQAGPRTVDAVTKMPRLNDRPQSEILRQET